VLLLDLICRREEKEEAKPSKVMEGKDDGRGKEGRNPHALIVQRRLFPKDAT
jgi:hypothetical protein